MNIELKIQSEYSPYGPMAFSANWQDDEFRYHVWLGLDEDSRLVVIGDTIYKNPLVHIRGFNTIQRSLSAKANAPILAEIKRIATRAKLMDMFTRRRNEIQTQDTMRADAERLNRIYDAWQIVNSATVYEKLALGLI